MDFGELLHVAKKNSENVQNKNNKFYSTKFAPPKKESKVEKKLSENIKKFLEKKEQEERAKAREEKEKLNQLLAMRDERSKNKIRKMLKVTKSANRSVLDDVDPSANCTVAADEGLIQPDEDDYGYVSNTANELFKKYVDKVGQLPEEPKFSASRPATIKDLSSTKDRVKAAILKEQEEKSGKSSKLPSSTTANNVVSNKPVSVKTNNEEHVRKSRRDIYDPQAEKEAEEQRKKEEQSKKAKLKPNRPLPPPLDFQQLLQIAEKKQFEPIELKIDEKKKEPERLLTKKEKQEMEERRRFIEERERRKKEGENLGKNGIVSKKIESNGRIPKINKENPGLNSRIPKLNEDVERKIFKEPAKPGSLIKSKQSANQANNSQRESQTRDVNDKYDVGKNKSSDLKPGHVFERKETPISKIPNKLNSANKIMNGSTAASTKASINLSNRDPHVKEKKPLTKDIKSKDVQLKNIQKTRDFPPKDLQKTREFPPKDIQRTRELPLKDIQKTREFPPKDIQKTREFPPKDIQKTREFPPRDIQKTRQFPPADLKRSKPDKKPIKRRILDDDDEDYDSEMDDFIDDGPEDDYGSGYSKYIREIFGYDKSRYRDIDEDDAAMESSFAQQMREETISKKIGLMEDLEDMRKEAEEKKRKMEKFKKMKYK